MPVSKKMIKATSDNVVYDICLDLEGVAQAVINAAWTRFDPDDQSTWPTADMDNEETYVVHNEGSGIDVMIWIGPAWWKDILYYASPDDLLYVRSEKND